MIVACGVPPTFASWVGTLPRMEDRILHPWKAWATGCAFDGWVECLLAADCRRTSLVPYLFSVTLLRHGIIALKCLLTAKVLSCALCVVLLLLPMFMTRVCLADLRGIPLRSFTSIYLRASISVGS